MDARRVRTVRPYSSVSPDDGITDRLSRSSASSTGSRVYPEYTPARYAAATATATAATERFTSAGAGKVAHRQASGCIEAAGQRLPDRAAHRLFHQDVNRVCHGECDHDR